MVKILSPKNDVVFQKLFGTEQHKEILISFLNSILIKSGNEEIKSRCINISWWKVKYTRHLCNYKS